MQVGIYSGYYKIYKTTVNVYFLITASVWVISEHFYGV
jgi:hypothetical protein